MAQEFEIVLVVLTLVFANFLTIAVYASRYKRVPPNRALVVFGRRSRPGSKDQSRVVLSGGRFVTPIIESYGYVVIEPLATEIKLSGPGPRRIRFVVRVPQNENQVRRAATQFLDKHPDEIRRIAGSIVEGHALGLIDRNPSDSDAELAAMIRTAAKLDFEKLGLEIVGPVVVSRGPG